MKLSENRSGTGFTLVELLIVLGIIAVLAAIIFPIFASVREKGRRTACLSNERQLGIAMQQYVADENGVFPNELVFPGDKWVTGSYPYVKDIALYRCSDGNADTYGCSPSPQTGFPLGYGLNTNLGHFQDSARPLRPVGYSLSALTAPAKTVLFFEVEGSAIVDTRLEHHDDSTVGNGGDTGSAQSDGHGGDLTDPTYPISGGIGELATYATGKVGGRGLNGAPKNGVVLYAGSTPRHSGGANYAACDGHALWLRPDLVSGGENAVAAECDQGTMPSQPSGCTGQTEPKAAGAANAKYTLTFSVL